ncbi:unnamed protein product [Ilex paraguariensis]|uniref:MI domain-containing protein n=1 Tax=Ilex paraguariensis TaxID=185542 RepID=A0ABC8UJF3_9AQUA
MAADNEPAVKSRKTQRKEARLVKKKKKFDSWVGHQKSRKVKKFSKNSKRVHVKFQDQTGHKLDDDMSTLLEGIPSAVDSLEKEETLYAEESSKKILNNETSRKKLKKSKSIEQEVMGEVASDTVDGASDLVDADRGKNDGTEQPTMPSTSTSKLGSTSQKMLKKKTKFQEYLEMEMQVGVVSADEDLALERKLAKKLKLKEGKLRGDDDDMNALFEGIPSVIDSFKDGGNSKDEEVLMKSLENSASLKKRKRVKSSGQGPQVEMASNTLAGVSEPVKTSDAELAIRNVPIKAPALEKSAKYVAPHLRSRVGNESEEYYQIRKQIRGLLNRLSEANMESITGEMSRIFGAVSRSAGSQIISEEILASCSGGPRGNEQYAAVFAAFVAGMACLVGMDFGAKLLASLAKCFEDEYLEGDNLSLRNLTLLVSYLYMFGVCSSDLIYDFLIMLSKRLMEIDVSTILTTLQCCGMKLRADDPAAMKNFIVSVHNSVNELKAASGDGESNLSGKRMEFMLETICDIKNNKKRAKEDTVQHTRIKKWLQKLRVDDILIRGLKWSKLLNPDKKGQWWLCGDMASSTENIEEVASTIDRQVPEAQKMLQLAASQRMNTDARRAIFCIIMSGEDYIDAFEKLLRLDLPVKQDREIMRVLVDCCLHEKVFNKYYCVLASKLCSHDKNHKFTLQFCLWDHFKELESMQLIRSMHLSKFVAEMFVSFSLSLAVLKAVDLSDTRQLTPKKIMHFRLLFEAVFEFPDRLVWNIFTRIAVTPEYETLRNGIVFFVSKYVVSDQKSSGEKFKIAKRALNNVEGVIL